ncbi:phosphoglycerate mutase-like protein [Coprinopsis marcescibilis]|uniref:Phosphoglycerate mutase-like protein n=1 Tax=Coprinopsis marcescibilis TaxID=230819 RepID=A0A5C3LCJ1_COPMA|nr:phosphoglycerate mutase-like protein [Coprinopsis marcescibilis]
MAQPMPRLFIVRHGETEWSQNGRHTGRTDIPLTSGGEEKVKAIAERLVGPGNAIDSRNIATAIVSPRQRAHRTFDLLFVNQETPKLQTTEEVREWDYGDYEGLTSSQIKKLKPTWSIWKDGCPGGETVTEMEKRVDTVIEKVREHHKAYVEGLSDARDVLLVAHGHFNRVLISRWINVPLSLGTHFNVEPGSVAVLGYNHHSLEEPAVNALNLFATIL